MTRIFDRTPEENYILAMEKTKSILYVFALTVALPALAAATLKSEGKVHLSVSKNLIQITADPGFHLNKAAPAELAVDGHKTAPTEKTEKLISFAIPSAEGSGIVSLYVCDDSNTVCEPHQMPAKWGQTSERVPLKLKNNDLVGKNVEQDTDFYQALSVAKRKNKLVLVDFSARWCPPCIRLEHEVFNTKEFKALEKDYVVFKVDVDKESNYDLMKKYSIKAFPTMVVVNSNGDELMRYLDFQEKDPFVTDLKKVYRHKPADLATLQKKSDAGDKLATLEMAEQAYKSLQYEDAVKLYGKAMGPHFYESLISATEDKTDKDNKESLAHFQQVLRDAIAANLDYFYSLDWRLTLADALEEKSAERKQVLRDLIFSAQKWIDNPAMIKEAYSRGYLTEIKDLEIPEAYAKQGDAYEKLGDTNKQKQAYENAVKETLKLQPTVQNPTVIIYLVAYMKVVRPLQDIEPWIEKLEAAYPNEFTYVQRHAKLLYEKKQYERALPIAQKAYDMSYGYNRFVSGLVLAQVQSEIRQKKEAKTLISSLLESDEAKSPRNKKIVKSIEEFSKKL